MDFCIWGNGKSSADAEILALVTLLKIIDTVTNPYSDKEYHFLERPLTLESDLQNLF